MAVLTKKFSEFAAGGITVGGDSIAGLNAGNNALFTLAPQFLEPGTTAQRPVSPNNGDIRYNTDLSQYEFYVSSLMVWSQLSSSTPSVVEVTGTTQIIVPNVTYIINNAALVTLTLPLAYPFGYSNTFLGKGAGGWRISQQTGQVIHMSPDATTTGTAGYLASANPFDCLTLQCITANNTFDAHSVQGSIFIN